jgi:zinc transporter, ZIP family
MIDAVLAGLVAASSLLIGAAIALRVRVHDRALGLIMAFGAGVLISAVAYDLVLEAFETSSAGIAIAIGLLVGSTAFFVGDLMIDRAGGAARKSTDPDPSGSANAIFLGTVLDGVPESVVLGLTLLSGEGVSLAVLAAVFLSNLPEAISATTGFVKGGGTSVRILGLWTIVVVVSALAAGIGYAALGDASAAGIAFVQAFAAGAIITMLADSMMPEAYRHSRAAAGIATTLGFTLAFTIATLERG